MRGSIMARPLRITYPGTFYYVTSLGNERKDLFKSKRDRERFLKYFGSATQKYGDSRNSHFVLRKNLIINLAT